MKVKLDTKLIRADLENKNISYRELHKLGVSRKICDEISKSNDEPVEVPIPALITLAEIIKRPHSMILTKDSLDDLRVTYPQVFETEDFFDMAEEDSFDHWLVAPASENKISAELPWWPSNSYQAKPSMRQRDELKRLSEIYMKHAFSIGWLASVGPEIITKNKNELDAIETGLQSIISNARSLDSGASKTINDLAARAKKLESAEVWGKALRAKDYQVFYVGLTRPATFTEQPYRTDFEMTMSGSQNYETNFELPYKFEEEPPQNSHFLVVAPPQHDYVILKAAKKKEISWQRDLDDVPVIVDDFLYNKYGQNKKEKTMK